LEKKKAGFVTNRIKGIGSNQGLQIAMAGDRSEQYTAQ